MCQAGVPMSARAGTDVAIMVPRTTNTANVAFTRVRTRLLIVLTSRHGGEENMARRRLSREESAWQHGHHRGPIEIRLGIQPVRTVDRPNDVPSRHIAERVQVLGARGPPTIDVGTGPQFLR